MNIETRVQTLEKKAELLPAVKPTAKYVWDKKQVEVIKKEVLAFFRLFPGRIDLEQPISPDELSLQQEGTFWLSNHSRIQVMIGLVCSYDTIEDEIFTHPELSGLARMLTKFPRLRYPKFKGGKKNVT